MKKIFVLIVGMVFTITLFAQNQAETYINEALTLVKQQKYKEAQMALQDAMNELNKIVSSDVLSILPDKLDDLTATKSNDNSGTSMGMGAGTVVSRHYEKNGDDNSKTADVTVIYNSPMVASFSMLVNNPAMLNGSNQKSVRIGTRRALLETNEEEIEQNGATVKVYNFNLNLPVNQNLITVSGHYFDSEAKFQAFYQLIPFEDIIKAVEK